VFYRENNQQCVALANRDVVYARTFVVRDDFFEPADRIYLEVDGLDTIAEIKLNGRIVARTENMFRRYRFEVGECLQRGENRIEILFGNIIAEIGRRHAQRPLWNPVHTLDGAVHVRKSHCSFGWDWGPQIPDLGIWRPIRLCAYAGAKLSDVHVTQRHAGGSVHLDVVAALDKWSGGDHALELTIVAPNGNRQTAELQDGEPQAIAIADPQLWWPHGYGRQPLYEMVFEVMHRGAIIERQCQHIGLRTLRLEREQDAFGESFQFRVNGMALFARGANYIPEDVYLTRPGRQSTDRLLRDAVAANFNCVRVWGGGVYPSDDFYDLCDRYGLIVWQDLMFACGVYDFNNPAFRENIKEEVRDNLRRIRHHASLGRSFAATTRWSGAFWSGHSHKQARCAANISRSMRFFFQHW
jgi:beta-mannosidase